MTQLFNSPLHRAMLESWDWGECGEGGGGGGEDNHLLAKKNGLWLFALDWLYCVLVVNFGHFGLVL